MDELLDYIEDLAWAYEGATEEDFKPEAPVPDNWLLEEKPWIYD